MTYLNQTINVRVREIEKIQVAQIVKQNPELFDNEGHFVRCAILKHIREWKDEPIIEDEGKVYKNDK